MIPEACSRAETEAVLRCAVTSLQNYLAEFGLIPSRIFPYLDIAAENADPNSSINSQVFPPRSVLVRVVRHEAQEELLQAVVVFIDSLLAEDAPSSALFALMQALLRANDDPDRPNRGAWRVHDIITMACAYLPLQQAFLEFLGQGHDVDLEAVVTRMNDRRILKPVYTLQVLESFELNSMEATAVRLLASLYATKVDNLMEDFAEYGTEGNLGGRTAGEQTGQDSQLWLRFLVECVDGHGGQGRFGQTVPQSLLLNQTWASTLDQLAYGRRVLAGYIEEAESEAGESVASDGTLVDDEDDVHDSPNNFEERQPVSALLADNLDLGSRHRRTMEYVYGGSIGQEIACAMEIYRHEYQLIGGTDVDDARSEVTTSSASTENNSQVKEPVYPATGNLTTSLRTIDISGDGQIALRAYQEELLCWAREGKNVAIVLPTGTGKTFIVLKYMQEHLSRPGSNRVMFIAPTIKLAEQQFHRFRQYFPKTTYFRCGKYRSNHAPFFELLDTYHVFVMTPQSLVEAIQHKEVQLTDFSLLVLDECHHIKTGKSGYHNLMALYLDIKCAQGAQLSVLPQVIGLTASPGVGTGGDLQSAGTFLKELCYKMDVERICTVHKHTKELECYVSKPKHEIHKCNRRKIDGFKRVVEDIMLSVESSILRCLNDVKTDWGEEDLEVVRRQLTAPDLHRGRPLYSTWLAHLENKVVVFSEQRHTYSNLICFTEMLVIYQRCLILNEDSESRYALDFLKEQAQLLEKQVPTGSPALASSERLLLDQLYSRLPELQKACDDPEDYNPKLLVLEEVLLEVMERCQNHTFRLAQGVQEDFACMVFVRSLQLTKAIERWGQEHPQLSQLRPKRVVGCRRQVSEGGITRQEWKDVVVKFNNGTYKLLVCTSVAEEGLEFHSCNVVVRYDYVTGMISMIQTRGRARRMDSRYLVMGNLTQRSLDREKENLAFERLMHQAVLQVQTDMDANPNSFLGDMRQWQQKDCDARKRAKELELQKDRKRLLCHTPYQLLCRKCQCLACMSADFRVLDRKDRAVVAPDFRGRWKRVETDEVFQLNLKLEKIAKVHCKACSYDWGILVRYTPTGKELPVLKMKSFFLVDTRTGEKTTKKLKWSQVPFHVEAISDEELL